MTLPDFLSGLPDFPEISPVKSNAPKTRLTYIADFETTTNPNDCRVWGWGLACIDYPDSVEIEHTIDEFIDRISFENSVTYFHNLKFDAMFLIDWLLRNDFFHVNVNTNSIGPESFQTLISDMGKFYSMTVKWANGNVTEFRDSLKKLPMTVARIAKSFDLEESKGEIDYEKTRPIGYVMTEEERDYIRRDVSIVAHAMREVVNAGMKKLTVASDSLNEFKRIVTKDRFKNLFPVFTEGMDKEIRRAYRGGFTWRNPRFGGFVTRSGLVLDVNSLYPSVMKNRILPYGEPEFEDGYVEVDKYKPLAIFSVTFTATLKPNHIPCIQIKGSSLFHETEYLTEIVEPVTLMVTNVDWDLYNDHYDIQVLAYGGGWKFHAVAGMFDEYIEKWAAIKESESGGKREIAKLHLNSLYGKFASNPNVTSKYPVLRDNVVRLVRGNDETRPPVYTAVGVFITSYARELTIRSAQQNFDVFAYADTDSLHLLTNDIPNNIEIHPTKMGAWKHEYYFDAAFYIRAKAYLERHAEWCECKECKQQGQHYTNRIAGLPEAVSATLTFDTLQDGMILHGKLTPKAVPGGVVLVDTPFELKL
jgi:hypothetical protein